MRGTEAAHGTYAFKGIPFAAAPVGPLRFRPPERPERRGTACATPPRFGHVVPQVHTPAELGQLFDSKGEQGPDCLNLNVWTPDPGAAGLPVLVWIHGGAFVIGSGSDSLYDGSTFARDGVVCVTINYRLGAAGFHHAGDVPGTGCFGILDQIAALEWVQENIAAFGGDPGPGDRRRGVGRRHERRHPARHAGGQGPLPPGHPAERRRQPRRCPSPRRGSSPASCSPSSASTRPSAPTSSWCAPRPTLAREIQETRDVARFGPEVVDLAHGVAADGRRRRAAAAGRSTPSGAGRPRTSTCSSAPPRHEFLLFLGMAPEPVPDRRRHAADALRPRVRGRRRRRRPRRATGPTGPAPRPSSCSSALHDRPDVPHPGHPPGRGPGRQRRHHVLLPVRLGVARLRRADQGRPRRRAALHVGQPRRPRRRGLTGGAGPQALADEMHAAWVRFITDGDPGLGAVRHRRSASPATSAAPTSWLSDPDGDERLLWEGAE